MPLKASRVIRVALAALLTAVLVGSAALADSVSVKLNASAKIYQAASSTARSVRAPKGLRVSLTNFSGSWGQITYKGHTGYVKLRYLDRLYPIKAYTVKPATLYRDAGKHKLAAVAAGTAVYVVGVDGSYVRVKNKAGTRTAYIKGSMLSTVYDSAETGDNGGDSGGPAAETLPETLRSTTTSAEKSKIEYTIYVAQNLIGAPYAESAKPPKTFDCAKFAYYCYTKAQSGALKSSSKAQGYDERYAQVGYDELLRGDLVCFDTVNDDDLCDHVGIYLGGGYFIHASSAAKKVIVSSLISGYYKRTFSWGRRVFEG